MLKPWNFGVGAYVEAFECIVGVGDSSGKTNSLLAAVSELGVADAIGSEIGRLWGA